MSNHSARIRHPDKHFGSCESQRLKRNWVKTPAATLFSYELALE